jgi:hypothetical protein
MRLNKGRLDLKTLYVGETCQITTGSSSVRIQHGSHTIEMGLDFKGIGMGPIRDDRIMSIQDERGKGFFTYWLHLDKLAPRRLYEVLVTDRDDSGMPGWQISDRTPAMEPDPAEIRSGESGWSVLGKLLGRGGG